MSNRLHTTEESQDFVSIKVEIPEKTYNKILKLKEESDPQFYSEIYSIADQSGFEPAWHGCFERDIRVCGDRYFATWKIKEVSD
jgi:hypothetical protein